MLKIVLAWEAFKDWLAAALRITHWDLHVIVGLLLLLAARMISKRPLTSFGLLVPITALEGANELLDFVRYKLSGWPWDARSTAIEVALTLGPPFAVIVAARTFRSDAAEQGVR